MLDDFKFHLDRVDNVLLKLSERGTSPPLPSVTFFSGVYIYMVMWMMVMLVMMECSGSDFLSETVSITNIIDLMKSEKIKRDFEVKVIADAPYLYFFEFSPFFFAASFCVICVVFWFWFWE